MELSHNETASSIEENYSPVNEHLYRNNLNPEEGLPLTPTTTLQDNMVSSRNPTHAY